MTKVDIISGFLGAGKTTFIKKLIDTVYTGEKLVLIENEFGEIGIDGGFLKDAGIEITEMNSGCICCTLVGDFSKALQKVLDEYKPDRVIIEPSGVGKLSDVAKAIEDVKEETDIEISAKIAVVDGKKAKTYLKNFGEFFENQVEHATTIVVSRTQMMKDEKIEECIHLLRDKNADATIISTPWDQLSKEAILHALEHEELHHHEECRGGHDHQDHHHHEDHHHHHDDECSCGCGGHHHHDEHHHEHHHHEECGCGHDHGHEHHHHGECDCGHNHGHEHHHHEEHHHDHHHDGECSCGCGGHHHHHDHGHHHHHHHADEVFTSWGKETAHKYTDEELDYIVKALSETGAYGTVLRAKGIVAMADGSWKQFDLVPEEAEVRNGQADYTGRVCVIGTDLKEADLVKLFHV